MADFITAVLNSKCDVGKWILSRLVMTACAIDLANETIKSGKNTPKASVA